MLIDSKKDLWVLIGTVGGGSVIWNLMRGELLAIPLCMGVMIFAFYKALREEAGAEPISKEQGWWVRPERVLHWKCPYKGLLGGCDHIKNEMRKCDFDFCPIKLEKHLGR